MTETEPSAPLPDRDERRPFTEAEIVAQYQATLDPAELHRDKTTRLLGDHRLISGRCRCGFDARLDYFRYEQHVADAVLALVDDARTAERAEAENAVLRDRLARVEALDYTAEDIENARDAIGECEWQWFRWLMQDKIRRALSAGTPTDSADETAGA